MKKSFHYTTTKNKLSPQGTELPQKETAVSLRPSCYPVPQRGPDPHFGLCRSSYYELDRLGLLRLIRVRKPGNLRGRVLVPYDEMAALIRRLSRYDRRRDDGYDYHCDDGCKVDTDVDF